MHPRTCIQDSLCSPDSSTGAGDLGAELSTITPDPQIGEVRPKTLSVSPVIANHKLSYWLSKHGMGCVVHPYSRLLLARRTMQRLPAELSRTILVLGSCRTLTPAHSYLSSGILGLPRSQSYFRCLVRY